jgi:hypothetical protein
MTNYTPGEGYKKGYQTRMNGGAMPSNTLLGNQDPYWNEYITGWNDADEAIISEAREEMTSGKTRCCKSTKNKNFIQD